MPTSRSTAKTTFRGFTQQVARACGLLSRREHAVSHCLRVLTYHRVLPDSECREYPFASLVTPLSAFRSQMMWLEACYHVIPLGECVLKTGAAAVTRKRPYVCVTFDDGYADNYTLASPILNELNLRATFFITTGFIAGGTMLWFDRAAEHWRRTTPVERRRAAEFAALSVAEANVDSFPDWMAFLKRCPPAVRLQIVGEGVDSRDAYRAMAIAQLQDLHRRGHEIGSHTVSHPLLSQMTDSELQDELEQSRSVLHKWLGEAPAGICYPNGDHDDRIVAAALRAGYRYGCTTERGVNRWPLDAMRLRRIHIDPRRVTRGESQHDELGFRAELCLLGGPRC